jgi:GxxExxY protein
VVENKVVDQILDVQVAQVLTYLAVTGLEVGLILNYQHPSLQVRRVVKSRPACSLKKNLR